MDDELREHSGSLVALTTVPKDQLVKVLELVDREVGSQRRLLTLFADNTDANVGLEDHADVVTSIADSSSPLASRSGNLLGDDGLLGGTASADANTRRLARLREEVVLELLVAENHVKSATVNHENGRRSSP